MDFSKGVLRPPHITKSVDLEENVTTTSARTAAGYQKTGDLITLPYTEVVLTEQPFASSIAGAAPYVAATWKGNVSLTPTQDNWVEAEIAPKIIVPSKKYDAVIAAPVNPLGVIWNVWEEGGDRDVHGRTPGHERYEDRRSDAEADRDDEAGISGASAEEYEDYFG